MRRLILAGVVLLTCAVVGSAAAQGKPDDGQAYVDGQTVTIGAIHFITGPSPAELANANSLYIAAYPVDAGSTGGAPVTFASGYQPNCNPCFHPGLPTGFVYHDHVLTGAPTFGDSSTPRHLILPLYDASATIDPTFRPFTSVAALEAGEGAGAFQQVSPGASNPYEIDTGVLVVTPSLSSHA